MLHAIKSPKLDNGSISLALKNVKAGSDIELVESILKYSFSF